MTSHHNKLCIRELCTTAMAAVFLLVPVAVPGTAAAAVRQAKVAGSFYPAEDSQLRQMVRRLLDEAPAPQHPRQAPPADGSTCRLSILRQDCGQRLPAPSGPSV